MAPTGELKNKAGEAVEVRAGGHWYVLMDEAVELAPEFDSVLHWEAANRPDVGIFYVDQALRADDMFDLRPDFDITMLISHDYIGLPLAVQAGALMRLNGLRREYGMAASYDLLLRAAHAGIVITRISQCLASRERRQPQPSLQSRHLALESWLGDDREHFKLQPGLQPQAIQLRRRFDADHPPVTFCVPTRQGISDAVGRPHVLGLLETIARLDYPMDKLRVIVGDDLPDGSAYAQHPWPFELSRIVTERGENEPFNYAQKMNRLWRLSETEQIVLMNDDVSGDATDWLQALLTFSMQEDVGGVGARLLYPNLTIQHTGIPGGLFDLCAHAWLGNPANEPTYQNWATVHREWSMVTGAVFATRRSVLEEIDGFDEVFRLEFNDVDMCLRLKMLGYRIVYTPHAELIHHEKASRGESPPPGSDLARFLKRWNEYLADDPMFHPAMDRKSFTLRPSSSPIAQLSERLETVPKN